MPQLVRVEISFHLVTKLLYYVIIVVTCVENVIVYCIITNVLITNVSDKDLHFFQMFKEESVKFELHESMVISNPTWLYHS